MTYKINGVALSLQPSSGGWSKRTVLDTDGNGHSVYPAVREYEMQWNLMEESDFDEIQAFFDSIPITGSAIVELPEYASAAWQFKAYTGCILHEPTMGDYFNEHPTKVTLLVTKIRT